MKMYDKANRFKGSRARGCKRTILLQDKDRFRLLYGPYEPPLFKRGILIDAIRGKVRFGKYSIAPIPWPIFKKQGSRGSGGMVLCGDLLRALKSASTPAICYHWGVCAGTVVSWRRTLGFRGMTPGAQKMVNMGVELCKLPQSQSKLATSARTRGMSEEGRETLRRSFFQRLKRKYDARLAFYRRTGRFPKAGRSDPWLPQEQRLLAKYPTRQLMSILGRTWEGIQDHRRKLNIRLRPAGVPWKEMEIKLLGSDSDTTVARHLNRSVTAVKVKRKRLGIPAFRPVRRRD